MMRTQELKGEAHRVKTQTSRKGSLSVSTGTLVTHRQTFMGLRLRPVRRGCQPSGWCWCVRRHYEAGFEGRDGNLDIQLVLK